MCAARVEVFSEQAKLFHDRKLIGEGRGVYDLRNSDPYMDLWKTKPVSPPGSIGRVFVNLGEGVGSADIFSEEHNTYVQVNASGTSTGINGMRGSSELHTILDESHGFGKAEPVSVSDPSGKVLMIVNHVEASK